MLVLQATSRALAIASPVQSKAHWRSIVPDPVQEGMSRAVIIACEPGTDESQPGAGVLEHLLRTDLVLIFVHRCVTVLRHHQSLTDRLEMMSELGDPERCRVSVRFSG